MTDKELLELSAKAAGYVECYWLVGADYINVFDSEKHHYTWNPLADDGDALRLAVKLGLDVCIDSRQEREPYTNVVGFYSDSSLEMLQAIEKHGDPYAATRRAIVRAAAEIGKEADDL